ncbi:MAG: Ig-like domain-containing protein [Dehalococcoidia bacterium]|nr:Ig-like domain-containing protein [Dehalococcoidia bacterium]
MRSDIILDEVPHKIEAMIITGKPAVQAKMAPPKGWVRVSDVWEILGYTYNIPHRVLIDPPAKIVIGYDQTLLPAVTEAIALFYYDEDKHEWIQLEQPPGYVAEEGQIAAITGHFSIFAVLAKPGVGPIEPSPPPGQPGTPTQPTGPVTPVPQANFIVRDLVVNPPKIDVGASSTITAIVENTGGLSGEYTATLTLDGEPISSKTLTLGPGESQPVEFVVTPGLPGTYGIDINQLDGQLEVIGQKLPLDYRQPVYWWLVVAATTALIILIMLVRVKSTVGARVAIGAGAAGAGAGATVLLADALKEIHIVPQKPTVGVRTSLQLKAFARYYNGTEDDITKQAEWKSSAPATAEVLNDKDFRGLLFAHTPGTVIITARWKNKDASTPVGVNCNILDMPVAFGVQPMRTISAVPVRKEVDAINIVPKNATIEEGQSLQYRATASYTDGRVENVTEKAVWTSTNDFVADIDTNGKARGYAAGITAIIATFRGKRGTTNLNVRRRRDDTS